MQVILYYRQRSTNLKIKNLEFKGAGLYMIANLGILVLSSVCATVGLLAPQIPVNNVNSSHP